MSSCVNARGQNPERPRWSAYSHIVRQSVGLTSPVVQEISTLTKITDLHSYGHFDAVLVLGKCVNIGVGSAY
jgi:hypothetical protein